MDTDDDTLPRVRLDVPRQWSPAQRERFRQELLDLLGRQAAEVPLPVFIAAVFIAAVAWQQVALARIAAWLMLVAAVLLLRMVLLPVLASRRERPAAPRLRIAVLTSAGSGLAHCAAAWLFFPALDVLERSMVTLVMIGMVSGAVAVVAGHLPAFACYAAPVLLTLAWWWVFRPTGTPVHAWYEPFVGALVLLHGLVLARFAGLSQRLLRRAFASGLTEEAARAHAERGWREAELQLQRAEAASQAKTRFLSAASHDLRQPLQAMQWLGDALVDASRDDRRLIVDRMSEAIESLEGLLKKLLDRSQLDAGVVRPDASEFDLAALFEQVERDYAAQAAGKGLRLEVRCPAGLRLRSDRTLLLSVLRNLIENAIKYTDAGRIEITAESAGDGVRLRVVDTGRGIPAGERERVFEEFYQVDNRQRDASRGFGLGLSIVRGYCELLGIALSLESSPGRGTTFELIVPPAGAAGAPADDRRDADAEVRLPEGLRVLVVEDDPRVLDAERAVLGRHGCRVVTATSVAEANGLAADGFDLVVTDYRLPDGTGLQVIDALRARRGRPVAALIVTGDTGAAELQSLSGSGHEWLTKPVRPSTLLAAMQRALGRGRR